MHPTPTLDQILARLALFTDEQRSLAWSPEPPYVATGPHDCRLGGDCGLDFNYETPRARWRRARYRWTKENARRMSHAESRPMLPASTNPLASYTNRDDH